MRCAATSATGHVRAANEDAFSLGGVIARSGVASCRLSTESALFRRFGLLLAVADGIGGTEAGAEASRIVLTALTQSYYEEPRGELDRRQFVAGIRECVKGAAGALQAAAAREPSLLDSGTTLCVMALQATGAMALLWAGDSRGVWVTAGGARQLTTDHALSTIRTDSVTGESSAVSGHSLFRYIDSHGACAVDMASEATWVAWERYVLGTDGWYGSGRGLPWDEVVGLMRAAASPEAAAEQLVAEAVAVDGSDNATALVAWCEE